MTGNVVNETRQDKNKMLIYISANELRSFIYFQIVRLCHNNKCLVAGLPVMFGYTGTVLANESEKKIPISEVFINVFNLLSQLINLFVDVYRAHSQHH